MNIRKNITHIGERNSDYVGGNVVCWASQKHLFIESISESIIKYLRDLIDILPTQVNYYLLLVGIWVNVLIVVPLKQIKSTTFTDKIPTDLVFLSLFYKKSRL